MKYAVLLFTLVFCSVASRALSTTPPAAVNFAQEGIGRAPADPGPRYNDYAQIACHNCYEKQYAKRFYDVLNSTKTVELDFYDAKSKQQEGRKARHWYVRHDNPTFAGSTSGNDNNCTGDGQGTNDLAACLGDIAQWSKDHPGHDVITVMLDKKQDWGEDRQPSDLDNLIAKKFPDEQILTVGDIMDSPNSYTNLRKAVNGDGWRPMSKLKNMFIFVITGGEADNHNRTQSYYIQKQGRGALCFVAPDTDEKSDITGNPNQFTDNTAGYVVFYNLKDGVSQQGDLGRLIQSKRYVSRLWGGDDNSCSSFSSQRINLIALFNFKKTCNGMSMWMLPPP